VHPAHAADQQTGEPSVPLFLVLPDGRTRLAAVAVPNGMALDHDGPTLIVAEMVGRRLTAIDVADDGTLSGRRVFADLGNRKPDGICADSSGAGSSEVH
jgi:sugar lactone lactonase YvrE